MKKVNSIFTWNFMFVFLINTMTSISVGAEAPIAPPAHDVESTPLTLEDSTEVKQCFQNLTQKNSEVLAKFRTLIVKLYLNQKIEERDVFLKNLFFREKALANSNAPEVEHNILKRIDWTKTGITGVGLLALSSLAGLAPNDSSGSYELIPIFSSVLAVGSLFLTNALNFEMFLKKTKKPDYAGAKADSLKFWKSEGDAKMTEMIDQFMKSQSFILFDGVSEEKLKEIRTQLINGLASSISDSGHLNIKQFSSNMMKVLNQHVSGRVKDLQKLQNSILPLMATSKSIIAMQDKSVENINALVNYSDYIKTGAELLLQDLKTGPYASKIKDPDLNASYEDLEKSTRALANLQNFCAKLLKIR